MPSKAVLEECFNKLCSLSRFPREDRLIWLNDYIREFAGWSDFAMNDVTGRWLRGPKAHSFPTPHELKASVEPGGPGRAREPQSCGRCHDGLISYAAQTYRCTCHLGSALRGEWERVKVLPATMTEAVDPADPDCAKGLDWIEKHAPEVYALIPDRVKNMIRNGAPF